MDADGVMRWSPGWRTSGPWPVWVDRQRAAVGSWYDGVGHMPFIEAPERFNLELAAFVDRAGQ